MFRQKKAFFLRYIVFIFLLGIATTGAAQSPKTKANLSALKKAFASFEYRKVVQLADELLQSNQHLSESDKLEALRMKAIAYYVLDQNELATLTFIEILKIKPDYRLDPLKNSPKIIRFFETIKKNYHIPGPSEKVQQTEEKKPQPAHPVDLTPMRALLLKSMILPGLGHQALGERKKGSVLLGASLIALSASAYFIWQTHVWEERYLNAVDQADIDNKYEAYNKAYRWRNAAIVSYALIWAYAQFDLSTKIFHNPNQALRIQPTVLNGKRLFTGFALSYSF